MKGLFAIDPGGSTGVAWGIFNNRAFDVKEALSTGIDLGSLTFTGSEHDQALALFNQWMLFKQRCVQVRLLDPENVELIIEDFTLFPGAHAGGKEGVAPIRVAWLFEGYRRGRGDKWSKEKHVSDVIWQPSTAMRHEQRLKDTPGWVRGRQHERAAFCHIYARLQKLLAKRT